MSEFVMEVFYAMLKEYNHNLYKRNTYTLKIIKNILNLGS